MDALKAQMLRMQQQLQGLNSSQRMLAGSLVVIMVMTLLGWARYSSAPEMAPLLNQSFSAEESAKIVQLLDGRGIQYVSAGDKILVPVDKRTAILGDLSFNNLMPSDTHKGYEDMLKMDTQWNTAAKSELIFTNAKAAYLGEIIRNWPGVASANVLLDATNERRIGSASRMPTAAVYIKTRTGVKLNAKAARAVVSLVTGAQSGLEEKNVKVVINDLAAKISPTGDGGMLDAEDLPELQFSIAGRYSEKITTNLNIPGALVDVSVVVENKTTSSQETQYDPKGVVKAEVGNTEDSSESNSTSSTAKEPGTVANAGLSLEAATNTAPAGNTTSRTKTESKSEARFSQKNITIHAPGGSAQVTGASVRVPRSYFVQVWKMKNGAKSDPDDAALETVISKEIPTIRQSVRALTNIQTEDAVVVAAYSDLMPIVDPIAMASANPGMTMLLGGHVKEIAMGSLAMMSLFMVSMIVKKSAPVPAVIRAMEITAPKPIDGGEELFGIAGASAGTLDAMELGEDEVRAQQVVEQVSGLVKENPDAAAALVKRWLSK